MGIIVIISSNIILPYLLCQAKSHHLPDNIPEQMSGTRQKELKIEHLLDKKGAIKEKAERVIIPKSIICWKISEHLSSLRSPLNIIPRVLFVISPLCLDIQNYLSPSWMSHVHQNSNRAIFKHPKLCTHVDGHKARIL